MKKDIGLYIHIPFCKQKCSYCDFVSFSNKEELIERYSEDYFAEDIKRFGSKTLKIVMESGIPITMIPSRMGRELSNFTEKEVLKIRDINDTGRFIYEMYSGYWEHGYEDRRIATNDTCAVLALRCPNLFKTKKAFFTVDVAEMPGRTLIEFNKRGNVNFAFKCNRKRLHEFYFNAVKKLDKFKFYN